MSIVFEGQEYEDRGAMPADVRARYEGALASGRLDIVATDDHGRPLPHDVGAALKQAGGIAGLMRAGKRAMEAQQAAEEAELLASGQSTEQVQDERRRASRSTLLFIGAILLAIALFVGEWPKLTYTFDGGRLFLYGGVFGLVASALVLRPLWPTLRMPTGSRVMLALFLVLISSGGGTALASIANRLFAHRPPESWSFTITDKRHLSSRSGWDVQAQVQGRSLRLSVPRERWQTLVVGRTYLGEVKQGALGFPFLTETGLR